MSPFFLLAFVLIGAQSSEIFSVPAGKVVVNQNSCSVVPHRVWKRFDQQGPKALREYSPETLKFLMEWARTSHGAESRIEEMMLKWDEQSICFNRPTTMELKKIAHGGQFSDDKGTFSYLEIPQYWVVGNEQEMESWRNVKIEECSSSDGVTYRCPETAFNDSCSRKEIIKCSEKIEMDSSDKFFTFVRHLEKSHVVATRVRRATVIHNGNIFDIQPVEIPKRIFMITLANTDMMSIGPVMLKKE